MTWNEFKKKVKDFFIGSSIEDADTTPYAEGEQELLGKLKEIADSFEPSYDPGKGYEDISELLPEKIDFVYREYEGDDEETIKSNTDKKYKDLLEADSKIVGDRYDVKVGELESKKKTSGEESAIKSGEIDDKYENIKQAIVNGLIQRGLYRSSIKGSQTKAAEDAKQSEQDALSAELAKKLGAYDAQIEKLRGEENVALEQLDLSYAQKLESEIQSLLDKRAKEIASIDDYNNKLKEKEAKYIENRTKAIEKQLAQRLKDELEIKAMENKYGYAGEKAENYSQRYDLAFEYYNSLPKDVALKMIDGNVDLQKYLGNYFGKLVTVIAKKDQ